DVPLPKIIKALNYMSMMFIERIKQLREQCQMPQQQLAAALEMDQATCCKIEKGKSRAKHEQVYIIAGLLKVDKNERNCFDWVLNLIINQLRYEYN
ncbi:MAG: helix-turn-helix domain-containing protein, partial [Bacteroidales bacterium]|nr:helix-turn-helix domain-containing protein [Bacteroidales bacterium]